MKGFKRSVYHLLLCKQPRTVSVTYLHLRFTFFFVSTNKRLSSCFLVKKRRKKRGHNRLQDSANKGRNEGSTTPNEPRERRGTHRQRTPYKTQGVRNPARANPNQPVRKHRHKEPKRSTKRNLPKKESFCYIFYISFIYPYNPRGYPKSIPNILYTDYNINE